jgi:hypothetical protein
MEFFNSYMRKIHKHLHFTFGDQNLVKSFADVTNFLMARHTVCPKKQGTIFTGSAWKMNFQKTKKTNHSRTKSGCLSNKIVALKFFGEHLRQKTKKRSHANFKQCTQIVCHWE